MFRRLRRFACLCAAGLFLLPAGCRVNLPMNRLLLNGPPTPSPLSSGLTPPLRLTVPQSSEVAIARGAAPSSEMMRTSHQVKTTNAPAAPTLPTPNALPAPLPAAPLAVKGIAINFDMVLRTTFERNADILMAREHVNESQIALDAAMTSRMPEMLRKDAFKKPAAEAEVWRRRVELRKTENEKLQDAANTYFDLLTALRGEAVARDLMQYEEKLLTRARNLVKDGATQAQVLVELTETALNGRRQFIARTHQQGEAAAIKLTYLMGMNGGMLFTNDALEPIDRVDTSTPIEVLVRQAQDNGPGARELQGLAASIQQGIDQARAAQCICERTGASLVCGRLQMARSQVQQTQLALVSLHGKLRAGVEEAFSAILSGLEQMARAVDAIQHAAETYRRMDLRLTKETAETTMQRNTHNAVLSSIQQLSQAHANYLTAVSNYNKAQARLLLLLGTYNECLPH